MRVDSIVPSHESEALEQWLIGESTLEPPARILNETI
jgi:hypothetical protein